ncbi:hypothetical protein AB4305_07845 [Nocardia sp. 2YAB30]|uniref:hypothetical protein n=1 Tax=unclassified Nocardia TaxID=2637762 RepID=UPI003F9B0C03
MVEIDALARASEFMTEETAVVADVVARLAIPAECSMVVVGGAGSTHLSVPAKAVSRCIVVDPLGLSSWKLPTRSVSTVHLRSLHEVSRSELPASPLLWVFTFNVFPYLHEPIEVLRRLASPRDTVVVTTWASTERAEEIRGGYLRYVFGPDRPRIEAVADVGHIARDLAMDYPGARVECVHGEVVSAAVVHLESV